MEELTYVKEHGANFFVTGNEYIRDSLDLKFIPCKNLYSKGKRGGVSLADTNQDLQQSYLVAKQIFEHVESGTIKFVLIGLTPYTIPKDEKELSIALQLEEKVLSDYVKLCLDNGAKPVCFVLPVNSALKKAYNDNVLKTFRDTINKVVKKYKATFIDLLDVALAKACFQNNTHLSSEGAAAVTALLSSRLYINNILLPQDLCAADDDFFNTFSKNFPRDKSFPNTDKPLIHHVFCLMACEDFNRLLKIMPKENCMDLMVRVFSELTYSYLVNLADILSKEDYNELITRIFNMTVENIRRKDKIKVGFYFEFSAHWCGDDVYNVFAKDERFEPTIFVITDKVNEFNRNEFLNDSEKFKARGLSVLEIKNVSLDIPKQDILFRLKPYSDGIPPAFCLTNLKIKETLLVHIPYTFHVGTQYYQYGLPMYKVLWKVFLPSTTLLKTYEKSSEIVVPRGFYSGYPKLDVFFKPDSKFHFDWKMAHNNAKKIIWAPHWSIDGRGVHTSTFRWNYQFMYEFAKSHPEISWVVKPHPLLFDSAISSKLFPSSEALKEYFQKWDDLPNARFYTGTYYQDIFATSDGMIQDCWSFTAEYQYVDKPMIYLTRDNRVLELRIAILNASYTVDGKDLEGIAAMIQRVIIEGDDYKAAERKEVFDKYLNYPKANGMLASEFIYKSIADDLKEPSTE